ncbi:hypothetical protein BDR06DRAFT_34577 [Suillus hirtellus]|nr:hypothetical protein BDR06DRAFT_34577 [Suillus hirtellus]
MESFTHTKLQSSCIMLHDLLLARPLSDLFSALSLPSLRVLEARRNSHIYASWHHESMQAFLARSMCPLETLTIDGRAVITDVQRAEYVSLIPSLEAVNYAYRYF